MRISSNLTINEIRQIPELRQARDALIGSATDFLQGAGELTLKGLQDQHPTWDAKAMAFGLERLLEISQSEKEFVFQIYSKQEIESDPALRYVTLIYHPAKQEATDTFALLLSGGCYGAVCNLPESMPVAARLNELGMTAFSLNYRTASPDEIGSALMPKPILDVARALDFIKKHFRKNLSQEIVGGFSAGGHLAQMWGAKYAEFDLPKPQMLMLAYPLVSLENLPAGPIKEYMITGLLGEGWNEEAMRSYSAHRLVTKEFPKTFAVLAEDDDTVPAQDSVDLETALVHNEISHRIERVKTGGHGFGLGTATDAAGWVDRAIQFLNDKT